MLKKLLLVSIVIGLSGCGFHFQGETTLAPPLHKLYLQTTDPYGQLVRSVEQYLKTSHVELVASPADAETILTILPEATSEDLLSVSGTQQTRQYLLHDTVTFEISDAHGLLLLPAQSLSEARVITVQSDQILGSSNEASLYYQQMRRMLAYSLMNRLASNEVTRLITQAFPTPTEQKMLTSTLPTPTPVAGKK